MSFEVLCAGLIVYNILHAYRFGTSFRLFFFFQAEDGIRDIGVTGVQTCALPISLGDDCAVVEIGDKTWVAASDMLVSGHHFKDWATPEDVGYKAVAVNVSDVARSEERRVGKECRSRWSPYH